MSVSLILLLSACTSGSPSGTQPSGSSDGDIYALPVNNVMYGIYYNKTLMEEHNWEVLDSRLKQLEEAEKA